MICRTAGCHGRSTMMPSLSVLEESYGFARFKHRQRFADSVDRYASAVRFVGGGLVYGYEVGTHRRQLVEDHIDHHLEFGSYPGDDVYQGDAVDRAERVVAHGDECAFLESVQHFGVVYPEGNLEIIDHKVFHELRSRCLTPFGMHAVHLVDLEKMHQAFYEPPEFLRCRDNLGHIAGGDHFGAHLDVRVFIEDVHLFALVI